MSITITIVDPTPAQIAALFGSEAPAKAEPKAKSEPKAKVEPKTEAPKDEPKADEVTHEAVVAAAQALVSANGRDALASLLAEFGAKNLSGVAEGDRAAFIARCGE